jgi:peptidoglycan/LPS O-acetylase OafA/YrhL
MFFVDYQDIRPLNKTAITRFLYLVSSFAHQAVIVFFVLSGFLVSASVLRAWSEGRWSWRVYLIDRFSRLYTVLIPALLLGLAWDRAGISFFTASPIYTGHAHNHVLNFSIMARSKLSVMLANALFLQFVIAPPFGSNGPLWSLSFEFWYYITFALCFSAIAPGIDDRPRLGCAIGAALVLLGVGPDIASFFPIWLLGAAINLLPPLPALRTKILTCVVVALLFAALSITARPDIHGSFFADALVAIATSIFIVVLVQDRSARRPELYSRVANRLAGFSYTLYLVHFPCLVFLDALIIRGIRWQPEPRLLTAALFLGAAVILYASLIASLTEARTNTVRRLLSQWIDGLLAKCAQSNATDAERAKV